MEDEKTPAEHPDKLTGQGFEPQPGETKAQAYRRRLKEIEENPELQKYFEEKRKAFPKLTREEYALTLGLAPLEAYNPEEQEAILKYKDFLAPSFMAHYWLVEHTGEVEAEVLELTEAFPDFGEFLRQLLKEGWTRKNKKEGIIHVFGYWTEAHFLTFRANMFALRNFLFTDEGRDFYVWMREEQKPTELRLKEWLGEFEAWRKARGFRPQAEAPEYIRVSSALPIQRLAENYSRRCFKTPPDGEHPYAPIRGGGFSGGAWLKPRPEITQLNINWEERIAEDLKNMGPLTADVFEAVMYLWGEKTKGPRDPVWVRVEDILELRGIKKKKAGSGRRGGYDKKAKKEHAKHVSILFATWLDLYHFERRQRGKKPEKMFIRGPLLALLHQLDTQLSFFGPEEAEAWEILPEAFHAQNFYLAGKETMLLSQKILGYNPKTEGTEKNMGRYFSWLWRIEKGKAKVLCVETILSRCGISIDEAHPNRTKDKLEKALERLEEDEILCWEWERQEGGEDIVGKKNWVEKWLKWTLKITPPPKIAEHYAALRKKKLPPGRKALPAGR